MPEDICELLDFNLHMKQAKRWKQIDYGYGRQYTFTLGQVVFAHGQECSDAGIKREVLNLTPPFGCFVHSHTHRPVNCEQIRLASVDTPWWRCNTGTAIDWNIPYAKKWDTSRWGAGCVVGHANTKRRFSGSREWEAETLIFNKHVMDWNE